MKNILIITAVIAAIFAESVASAQTRAVLKNKSADAAIDNTITESLTIGSGKTLTIASGATINAAAGSTVTGFGSGGTWGSITGTLSNQTDLNTALGLKLSTATASATYATLASLGGAAFLDASADATAESVARYDDAGRLRATSVNFKDNGFEASLIAESLTGNVGYRLPSEAEHGLRLLTTGGSGANLTALNASAITSGTLNTARLPTTITGLTSVTSTTFVGALTGTASGNAVLTGNAFVGANTTTVGTNSATPVAGESLTNSTAAISGTQSASPALIFSSKGWKTTATAASQEFQWRVFSLPIQGTTAPDGTLVFQTAQNGGAFTDAMHIYTEGAVKYRGIAFPGAFTLGASTSVQSTQIAVAGNIVSLIWSSTTKQNMTPGGDYLTNTGGMFGWSGLKAGYESADVLQINNGTLNTLRDLSLRNLTHSAYIEGAEMTAPAAPAANKGRIYFEDSGGKTRLMVIFPSGAAQQIAIEP